MVAISGSILGDCLRAILRPLASFCLRHGVKVQQVEALFRQIFLETATADLTKKGHKATTSKLTAMTGIHRKYISPGAAAGSALVESFDQTDLCTRVVGHWQTSRAFSDEKGTPKSLSYGTSKSGFSRLVAAVSRELSPATILFELERRGTARRDGDQVILIRQSFSSRGDLKSGFEIAERDMRDLLRAVEHNCLSPESTPHHHARTEFDKLRLDEIKDKLAILVAQGHDLHKQIRTFLSEYDQDINPKLTYTGKIGRAAFTSFSFTEDPDEEH